MAQFGKLISFIGSKRLVFRENFSHSARDKIARATGGAGHRGNGRLTRWGLALRGHRCNADWIRRLLPEALGEVGLLEETQSFCCATCDCGRGITRGARRGLAGYSPRVETTLCAAGDHPRGG
eukprot:symbB.v1.2.019473.t1/scaffold1593.1/size164412/15